MFYWWAQGEQEILWGVYEGELHITRKQESADRILSSWFHTKLICSMDSKSFPQDWFLIISLNSGLAFPKQHSCQTYDTHDKTTWNYRSCLCREEEFWDLSFMFGHMRGGHFPSTAPLSPVADSTCFWCSPGIYGAVICREEWHPTYFRMCLT